MRTCRPAIPRLIHLTTLSIRPTHPIPPLRRITNRLSRLRRDRRHLPSRPSTVRSVSVKTPGWWDRIPGRLEHELRELRQAGIVASVDEQVLSAEDRVVLHAEAYVEGELIRVRVDFPDVYPYTRFEVYATELDLPHHQHPIEKNLCLIDGDTSNWRTWDTVAQFLTERLPLVLRSARSTSLEERAELEVHQAEPATVFLPYERESVVLVDSSWRIPPDVAEGWLEIIAEDRIPPFRAAIARVLDARNATLAQRDWGQAIQHPRTLRGRWIRLGPGARLHDRAARQAEIDKRSARFRQLQLQQLGRSTVDVIGFLFAEERSWEDSADAWFFQRTDRNNGGHLAACLVQASRGGASDLRERVPELQPLAGLAVTVVGLGGLGAPSAIEFARAGIGKLVLVDHDFVDAGTAVRWPLGLAFAGRSKTAALKEFLACNYPHVHVEVVDRRVGGMRRGTEHRDDILLPSLMAQSDLLYDATAEQGLAYLLSDVARHHQVPYVRVSTTPGAWGGFLVRIRPGQTAGCHYCLMAAMKDGVIPTPPQMEDGNVQPRGCASPTFTGAGFDVAAVALHGVRLGVSTLAGKAKLRGYPSVDWDVAVIGFRDQQGNVRHTFDTYSLERRASCELHQ